MFKKLFETSTIKISTVLLIAAGLVVGVVIAGFQFDVFQTFVPNDTILLGFLGFIALMFLLAMHLVEVLLERDDLTSHNKLDKLLSGELFADGLDGTRVAEFFARIARQKETNPAYYVDIDRHIAMLGDKVSHDLSGLAESAASQTKYGFIGTLVGIIIGLATFDTGAMQGSASEAAAILGVLMTGIGIAVMTTVVGLIGATILRKFFFYLEGQTIEVVNRLKEVTMSDIEPVLNANAKSGMVKVRLDQLGAPSGGGNTPSGGS